MLKDGVTDPIADAAHRPGGSVWGMGAALSGVGDLPSPPAPASGGRLGELTAFLNLFNLIPGLAADGSRGFHALTRVDRWVVVGAISVMAFITGLGILWIVGAVALWRALKDRAGTGTPDDVDDLPRAGHRPCPSSRATCNSSYGRRT
jgi:Zn-dependent protease